MMMLRRMLLRRKADPKTGKHTLCELAQSKRTRTFDKSVLSGNLQGKCPNAPDTTSINHQALTLTIRTPSVWPHCLGKNEMENGKQMGCVFETSQGMCLLPSFCTPDQAWLQANGMFDL